ncbi:PIG-F-domain-containing protein [Phellopilus nigrolimitatus]|nr:PIG-F-domain-containing protein [Phellopilus nigrolimitatus]
MTDGQSKESRTRVQSEFRRRVETRRYACIHSTRTMSSSSPSFPISRFSSLLGVHTTLLLFTALYLPRSSFLLSPLPPQASSRDRPQHAFIRPLTADPQLTLIWLCVGVGVVQASWATWMKIEHENARLEMFGDDAESRVERTLKSREDKLHTLKDALVATLAASFFFHVVLVLFGAPLIGHFSKTYLLALLLSLLIVYPNAYTLKTPALSSDPNALVHRLTWLRLFVELSPRTPHERFFVYPAVGAVLGSWMGAFPIALDWDRPWQAWPLTLAYGAIAGHIIGSWVALLLNAVVFLADANKTADADKARVEAVEEVKSKSKKGKKGQNK